MTDKYDEMADEQVAAATLGMMGYEQDPLNPWWYLKDGHAWMSRTALLGQEKHAFAAEVMQWMMNRDWGCNDLIERDKDESNRAVFYTYSRQGRYVYGRAEYIDMTDHPRAVCEAALRAKESDASI